MRKRGFTFLGMLAVVATLFLSSCAVNPYADTNSEVYKRERTRALVADIHSGCPGEGRGGPVEKELTRK